MVIIALTYYLSSVQALAVLPLLKQINSFMAKFDLGFIRLAEAIARRLPRQLDSARTMAGEFYLYARENPIIIEFILRKLGHVMLFFIITIAFFILWRNYLKPVYAAMVSFISGIVVAVLDETFQYLVIGRTGSIIDVFIDIMGVGLAIILIAIAFILVKPIYYNSPENGENND